MPIRQPLPASTDSVAIRDQTPGLTGSQPTLAFAPTSAGRPVFQLITLTEPDFDGPVTLSTDAPDYFRLASDSHPNFAPSLTVTPSPTGTYIHIRYLTNRRGKHSGVLTMQGSGEPKTILLTGRTSGLLPAVRGSGAVGSPVQPIHPSPFAKRLKQGAAVLSVLLAAGLTYTGYTNRCHLFPALCQTTAAVGPIVQPASPEPIHPVSPATESRRSARKPTPVPDQLNRAPQLTVSERDVRKPVSRPVPARATAGEALTNRRTAPAAPAGESELERELNQGTSH